MQFRYDAGLRDLQLIGEEEVNVEDGQRYQVSVNFLTGAVVFRRTRDGPRRREASVKARLIQAPPFRLQSYECLAQDKVKPPAYIDETLRVTRE